MTAGSGVSSRHQFRVLRFYALCALFVSPLPLTPRQLLSDWTVCPSCRFPSLHSAFVDAIAAEQTCPMCEVAVPPAQIAKVAMTVERLVAATNEAEEAEAEAAGEDGAQER